MSPSGDADPRSHSDEGDEGLPREALRIGATLRAMITDLGELVGLEARLAGVTLAAMCALGVLSAGLLVSGWILLQIGAVWWLRDQGLALGHGLLVAGGLNVLLALACWLIAVRRSRRLTFTNTRAVISQLYSHESTEQGR